MLNSLRLITSSADVAGTRARGRTPAGSRRRGAVQRHEQSIAGEHPLVRVDDERVGTLDPGRRGTELGADPGRARVGRVDVEPDVADAGRRSRRSGPTRWSTSSRPSRRPRRRRRGRGGRDACGTRRRRERAATRARARCAALSIDECVCSEQTTTRRSGIAVARSHERGQRRDRRRVLDVAVPARRADRAAAASQSVTCSSSSVSAGPVRQRMPTWLSVAVSSSARIAGSGARVREVGEEPRVLPVRRRGQDQPVHVLEQRRERLRLVRRRGRQPLAEPARLDLRQHRIARPTCSR